MGSEESNRGINGKKVKAIDVLAGGGTREGAARAAGVSDRTVRRWLQEAGFAAALDETLDDATREIGRRLVAIGGKAVKTLDRVMDDPEVPASARVLAAARVLDALAKTMGARRAAGAEGEGLPPPGRATRDTR